MTDLDELLKEVWPEVRRRHLFPELPAPLLTPGEERVALEIRGKRIYVSSNFVLEMSKVLPAKEVLEALLDHAVSHYLYCPWDFTTHLRLYREAKKVLKEAQLAQRVTDHFIDVVADTHCLSQVESPLPSLYRHLRGGLMDQALRALYQQIWGIDLGVVGHEKIARKLSRLPYLDRQRWADTIRRFAWEVQPLLRIEKKPGGMDQANPLGSHSLWKYSPQEIDQGLQELAMEVSPAEFGALVHDLAQEYREGGPSATGGMGLGPGHAFQADILYYMKLAENYTLPIRQAPVKKSGSLYPHQHVPWELGRPFQDVDPWTSFGKIMPGITQTWERQEMEVSGEKEGIPDCIVLVDSSGSMTNPGLHRSFAVLGAACASDAYLRNGAEVAVYNFSDATAGARVCLPYTRHRREIYRSLCTYFGGGTSLPVKDIEALQTDRLPDIFLITDMQIVNLELLIQYFNQHPNRVTAVHVGNNEHVRAFRKSTALKKNVSVYAVEKEEDILGIVLGKVREYLYSAPN